MSYRWWFEPTEWQAHPGNAPDARKTLITQMEKETKQPVGFAPAAPKLPIHIVTGYRSKTS